MSLDIYMKEPHQQIMICECPYCDDRHEKPYFKEVAHFNITHNLTAMADECGLYHAVWRPEENNIYNAYEMVKILEDGLDRLESEPERYSVLNPQNGWGSYKGFIQVIREYLETCKSNPDAKITVSR